MSSQFTAVKNKPVFFIFIFDMVYFIHAIMRQVSKDLKTDLMIRLSWRIQIKENSYEKN